MAIELRFLGAAKSVTGSAHLLIVGGKRVLLDCGQMQGSRVEQDLNRVPLPVGHVDAVVLSHAHIDHSGRLPLLYRQGFRGPIYTHRASRDLCEIMLRDAAYLHEKDAEWENKKLARQGLATIEPLYTRNDVQAVLAQFTTLEFDARQRILPGVEIRLRRAGHILGAAIVEVWIEDEGRTFKLVFSGDLGYVDSPLMGPPARIEQADLVIMESTYGDRNHRAFEDTLRELESIVRAAAETGGNILIPAFAVGRTQDLLYLLARHYESWRLDRWKIYLDSPMAIETTELYWRHRALHKDGAPQDDTRPLLANAIASLTTEDSMRINEVRSGALVIAGSGMCNGGRILHHLKHNLWRPECHVVLVGFQAQGTLGRRLVDGASHVSLWQETIKVAARIHTVGGLSAHADRAGLLAWYGGFTNAPPVCLVHGEPVAQEALAGGLKETYGAEVRIPARGDTLRL